MELNEKARDTKIVIKSYCNKEINRKEASTRLGIHQNSVSRLKTNYLKLGDQAFIHNNSSKIPSNKTSYEVESKIVNLYKEYYENAGFNFKHFYEYIEENRQLYEITYGECISAKTIYRILKRNSIISPQSNKDNKDKSHPLRARRSYSGELVQADASLHDWLSLGSNSKITLHSAIDDTTSTILAGYFLPTETLEGYLLFSRKLLLTMAYQKLYIQTEELYLSI